MKLDSLVVITGQKNADRCCLVGDGPQEVTVEGTDRYRAWQGYLVDPQLICQPLIDDVDIGS